MLITMSDKEIQRLAVLQDVRDHRITPVRAAEILNLSTRQITRLLQKLNQDGVSGMAHASRGQPGHRRHDDLLKSKCLSIISEHLLGFGPTLAHEKLSSMFALNILVETVRRWMTANDECCRLRYNYDSGWNDHRRYRHFYKWQFRWG
jgi:hypothetical protein